ncbi:hypothetical protein N8492_02350 [Synechococcus sp. AH-601-O06]|nr:hypothetical protein [Synechococcus sp. AH-601-O06]
MIIAIAIIAWIAYQLGKNSEIKKREDQELEDIVERIKYGNFNGSFDEAWKAIVLARASPSEWSESFTDRVRERLAEEARKAGEWT